MYVDARRVQGGSGSCEPPPPPARSGLFVTVRRKDKIEKKKKIKSYYYIDVTVYDATAATVVNIQRTVISLLFTTVV